MVGIVGFEPTQHNGTKVTASRDSPTSPHSQFPIFLTRRIYGIISLPSELKKFYAGRTGFEPVTTELTVRDSTVELHATIKFF